MKTFEVRTFSGVETEEAIRYTIARVMDWLSRKQTTLWSNWDITDNERRLEAAIWFWNEMADYMEYMEEELASGLFEADLEGAADSGDHQRVRTPDADGVENPDRPEVP